MKHTDKNGRFPMEFPARENRVGNAPVLDEPADPELITVDPQRKSGVRIERFTSVTSPDGQTADTEARTTL